MKRHVIIFICVVLISGWIGVLVDSVLQEQSEENSLGMGLWLILPLLTAIVLRMIHGGWRDMGFKLNIKGNIKWYAVSLLIYPSIMVVTVGIALFLGEANVSNVDMLPLLSLIAISMGGNVIKNIFEEFSWRGYLTPKLIELKMNDWFIYIISGLVWALWHAAYYFVFLPDYYFETTSRLGILLTGCVLMVCWSIVYVEIYRLTKSVWPCVFMHAVEDAIPNVLVMVSGIITFTKIGDILWNPLSGIVATAIFLGIGLLLRSIRIKSEGRTNTEMEQVV